MFGFKNILKNTSNSSLKVMASNNFIGALNDINSIAETSIKERDDQRVEKAKTFFNEAKKIINTCILNKDFKPDYLEEAADKLIKSIELNRNNAEAYLNLANIFYILCNNTLSAKYLKSAKRINPNLDGIDKLAKLISSEGVRNFNLPSEKPIQIPDKAIKPITIQPVKPQISPIKLTASRK